MNDYDDLFENQRVDNSSDQIPKEDYAARKKAERDDVFTLSDSTALEVASDDGKFQQYLDVQSRFDRYSAVNTLLILAQKPDSTRLADFDRWKSLGGFVKPGQSAISILEPHEYIKEDGMRGIGYNVKKVFDISQVDARKVKPIISPPYTERQLLAALISNAPMKISGVESLSGNLGAYTDPQTGEIFVRKRMEFFDTFRSVTQELCYAGIEQDGKNTANPHFTAYCATYLICKKYGVNTQDLNFESAPAMFRGFEAQQVKQELSAIRDTAEIITERMAKHLDTVQKAAKTQESRGEM